MEQYGNEHEWIAPNFWAPIIKLQRFTKVAYEKTAIEVVHNGEIVLI